MAIAPGASYGVLGLLLDLPRVTFTAETLLVGTDAFAGNLAPRVRDERRAGELLPYIVDRWIEGLP
jgi:hypothetical protein